jgi:hypothetical protein
MRVAGSKQHTPDPVGARNTGCRRDAVGSDDAIWRGGRSLSDEETLRALTAIGRCLWERLRRVVRWCLFRCGARMPPSDWRYSCRYQHAGRQPSAANQGCSTRAKMKHLENGARREAAGTFRIDTVRSSAAPRGAGVMLPNCALQRLFTCCLLVNTPALATITAPMWITHNPQRWAASWTLAPRRLRLVTILIGRAPLSDGEATARTNWRNFSGFMRKRGCSRP